MYNRALDAFKAVADSGSFSKAAELLFISHTAVIKQISALEEHLNVKLFRRSNQGAELTPAGQLLYQKTLEIIDFSEQAVKEIQKAQASAPTIIRIGTSLFYPCHIFMDLWESISDRHPGYQLQIIPIENDEQRFAGFNSAYDFLIGPYNASVSSEEFPFIPIGSYQFSLSMPRKHRLARQASLCFDDLAGERLMIMRHGNSVINDQIREHVTLNHPSITIEDISPHYSIRTFNQCVEENAILLSLECWKDVHPALVTIPLAEGYSLPYGILTSRKPKPELNGFIKMLQECLKR
ncbi:LysR family transcriptional regulator [Enterocloster bolteae]|uniref:LysR family transcriptional regulator n=1 Tax=Enterocloster bolteae TaxID=208479 RepID=UPI002A7F2C98|nr:LysR family transcriptional regulator [Enterocloster bolteae]